MNGARHFEHAAHDRTEVAVAEATAQTQADMFHELFRIEHVAEKTDSNQQMEILNQINSVAEKCHTWAKNVRCCLGHLQNFKDVRNRSWKALIEEDERLHAEQMSSISKSSRNGARVNSQSAQGSGIVKGCYRVHKSSGKHSTA